MRKACAVLGLLCCLLLLAACAGYRNTLMPRVTVTEEFTDNVQLVSENPEWDLITSVTPGVTLASSNPVREASLSYEPTIRHYAETGERLATLHAASLNAVNRFSRHSRFELTETFNYTDDPQEERDLSFTRADDPPAPLDPTRRTDREPYMTNTVNARFRHDLARDSFFFLNYTNSFLENEDPTVENNTRNEPSAAVTYWLNSYYGLETRARWTHADFSGGVGEPTAPHDEYYLTARFMRRFTRHLNGFVQYAHTIFDSELDSDDYKVYEGTVGVDYNLSRTTFLTFSGGYFWRDDELDLQGGYVLRADMARRFRHGSVRLSGGTGYRLTYGGAENLGFTEYKEVSAAGEYAFTRRVSGDVLASYTKNQYNDVEDREDKVMELGAGVNYRWNPWLVTRLRYSHRKTDSSTPGESYDENRVTLSITLVPLHPIILGD